MDKTAGENKIDLIAVRPTDEVEEREAYTFLRWVTENEQAAEDDSFLSIGEEDRKLWCLKDQITYLEASAAWHEKVTKPLGDFVLKHFPDRITHDCGTLYDLSITLIKENAGIDVEPSETYLRWKEECKEKFVFLDIHNMQYMHKHEVIEYYEEFRLFNSKRMHDASRYILESALLDEAPEGVKHSMETIVEEGKAQKKNKNKKAKKSKKNKKK